MKAKALLGQFVVQPPDERLQFRAFQLEAELGNVLLQQFFVAQLFPLNRFHAEL
jgi:hypothetical protein